MAVLPTDLLLIERGGIAYKTPVSSLPASAPSAHAVIPVLSGSYTSFAVNATALTTIAGGLNRLDFMPFIPARAMTINELAVEVTTLLAANLAHIGIYSDASGVPGSKLAETTVALNAATVGVKVTTINQALSAGTLYWIAVLTSLAGGAFRAVPVAGMLPLSSPASGTAFPTVRRATFPFALLPANAPATTPTSAIAPWVRMRVA